MYMTTAVSYNLYYTFEELKDINASQTGRIVLLDYSGISSNAQIYVGNDKYDVTCFTGRIDYLKNY